MPDSPHVRLRHPNRKRQPHVGESRDPVVTRKGSSGSLGVLLLLGGGLIFFCYIFNMGGLRVVLDGLFAGFDTGVRSHNAEIVPYFTSALPYLAVGIVVILLLVVLGILGRGAESLVGKRKPASASKHTSGTRATPRPAAEFIRPARLATRELDMKQNETSSAKEPSPTDSNHH